jgi:hypothetical protein
LENTSSSILKDACHPRSYGSRGASGWSMEPPSPCPTRPQTRRNTRNPRLKKPVVDFPRCVSSVTSHWQAEPCWISRKAASTSTKASSSCNSWAILKKRRHRPGRPRIRFVPRLLEDVASRH